MATEQSVTRITYPANADLSAKQYHFGIINASTKIAAVASQGADADGVISNAPSAADQECSLDIAGVVKVMAGATLTAGMLLTPGADGRAEEGASGDYIVAKAITGGADGELIEALLRSSYKIP